MNEEPRAENPARRGVLGMLCSFIMGSGLIASYGTLAAFAARFLYPAHPSRKGWQFVSDLASIHVGESIDYSAPNGQTITVARTGEAAQVDSFVALSNICPHLGCRVHWQQQNDRFYCPCHNGAFDSAGNAIQGPPKDAKQQLSRFPLRVEGNLLFIEVPMDKLQ